MVSTNTKLAEAARRLDDAIKDLPDGCEGWLEPLDERIAELRAALAAHAAPEAQQPAGQEQDERAAFEAWAATYSTFPLERDDYPRLGTTSYTQMEQTMLWDAWQAAMTRASAAVEAVAVQMPRPASWSGAVTPERVEQMLADYRAAVLRALGGK